MVSTAINPAPPRRELPRPPPPAVEESEQQWVFTEEELLAAPSIQDGMSVEEERALRRKGVNFILQVGMMLKLPQTTLSTAAVFFNRYLMRRSLKPRPGYKPLHHYVGNSCHVVHEPH
jgi:protein BUR2